MRLRIGLGLTLATILLASCKPFSVTQEARVEDASITTHIATTSIASPSGSLRVTITSNNGQPTWQASWNGGEIIASSRLGLSFLTGADLTSDLTITSIDTASSDMVWEQPWGERRFVRDHYNQLAVHFSHADGTPAYTLRVKLFDDGLGFRYEVPDTGPRKMIDERTEFSLAEGATAWWTPAAGWNRYEELYKTTRVDEVHRAHTPFTARLPEGPYISIHEAALVDYAGMWLNKRRGGILEADLAPRADGTKVAVTGAFTTPWRTVQVSDTAAGLANSNLILNLNAPNQLGDVSWTRPSKYVGIWWCMHINECTWGSGDKHGATSERTRDYIDFAADNGFDGVLVEGWNIGWTGDWFFNGEIFNFTQAYPDFDIEALAAYATERGVYLIGHHETSGAVSNYEAQMEAAFALYQQLGIPAVKTGYVADGGNLTRRDETGKLVREWHDGQFAVQHHRRVLELAAQYKITINAHEPVKDTGLRRTYPNAFSREGARGQEYNAWGQPPNDPAHTTILPFTRMLSGPMDFTPGIFDLSFGKALSENPRVQTTLAKQLALYVVLYSPIQMAADLPRNYQARPGAFKFIRDVPVDWQNSQALAGEPGEFFVIARQDRASEAWYLGAITNADARSVEIPLSFLGEGAYTAETYQDGADADWLTNPYAIDIGSRPVQRGDTLTLNLAPGGGTAIRFTPNN